MNIKKQIVKLKSDKLVKKLDENFKNIFDYLSYLYFVIIGDLNNYITSNSIDFYYGILDILESITNNLVVFQNHLKENIKINKNEGEKYLNVQNLENNLKVKLTEHLKKENIIFEKYLNKTQNFAKLIHSTIEFIQYHLIENKLVYSTDTDFKFISTFALPIKILKEKLKETNQNVDNSLNFVFESLKYLPNNKNSFVILTEEELKSLKYYNKQLNNIVNFPQWEEHKYKFIEFFNGHGEDTFPEFTHYY